ncbi:MAG: hypothetical protein AB7J28_15490 [Hyphomonadaceae bacterium]
MVDLVGTCPKDFWFEWIAEGDAAGDPETGEEWGWYTRHSFARFGKPGDRFYVVAHGLLRGYAPIVRVVDNTPQGGGYVICRRGGAVPVTLATPIKGFRGIEKRWWERDAEIPFHDWKTRGVAHCPEKTTQERVDG